MDVVCFLVRWGVTSNADALASSQVELEEESLTLPTESAPIQRRFEWLPLDPAECASSISRVAGWSRLL